MTTKLVNQEGNRRCVSLLWMTVLFLLTCDSGLADLHLRNFVISSDRICVGRVVACVSNAITTAMGSKVLERTVRVQVEHCIYGAVTNMCYVRYFADVMSTPVNMHWEPDTLCLEEGETYLFCLKMTTDGQIFEPTRYVSSSSMVPTGSTPRLVVNIKAIGEIVKEEEPLVAHCLRAMRGEIAHDGHEWAEIETYEILRRTVDKNGKWRSDAAVFLEHWVTEIMDEEKQSDERKVKRKLPLNESDRGK